ncbi:hypothetical protein CC2G_012353 [Coprinopsis cinerea AmutBmut pab1-1]|nr:hypothetical protein CC2G_012353 [Coprinopsis cinerea AmutBmut pab1-1]
MGLEGEEVNPFGDGSKIAHQRMGSQSVGCQANRTWTLLTLLFLLFLVPPPFLLPSNASIASSDAKSTQIFEFRNMAEPSPNQDKPGNRGGGVIRGAVSRSAALLRGKGSRGGGKGRQVKSPAIVPDEMDSTPEPPPNQENADNTKQTVHEDEVEQFFNDVAAAGGSKRKVSALSQDAPRTDHQLEGFQLSVGSDKEQAGKRKRNEGEKESSDDDNELDHDIFDVLEGDPMDVDQAGNTQAMDTQGSEDLSLAKETSRARKTKGDLGPKASKLKGDASGAGKGSSKAASGSSKETRVARERAAKGGSTASRAGQTRNEARLRKELRRVFKNTIKIDDLASSVAAVKGRTDADLGKVQRDAHLKTVGQGGFIGYARVYVAGGPVVPRWMGEDGEGGPKRRVIPDTPFRADCHYQYDDPESPTQALPCGPPIIRQAFNKRPLNKDTVATMRAGSLLVDDHEFAIIVFVSKSIVDLSTVITNPTLPGELKLLRLAWSGSDSDAKLHIGNGNHRSTAAHEQSEPLRKLWGEGLTILHDGRELTDDQRREATDIVKNASMACLENYSWAAKLYDFDYLNNHPDGHDAMLLLASNTAFASNPDSSFDTLINLTTTLATQGYKPDVWKKHIQGFVDRRAISGASKGVSTPLARTNERLKARLWNGRYSVSRPAPNVALAFLVCGASRPGTQGSPYTPDVIQFEYAVLDETFWKQVDVFFHEHLSSVLVAFATPRSRVPKEMVTWHKAVSNYYDSLHAWLTDNADKCPSDDPNLDIVKLLPERLLAIKSKLVSDDLGALSLPLYPPKFAYQLISDVGRYKEAIYISLSMLDPGFVTPIHSNSSYTYEPSDFCRWVSTFPVNGCTAPKHVKPDDHSDAIQTKIAHILLAYRDTVLAGWSSVKDRSEFLRASKTPEQVPSKELGGLLLQYTTLQADAELLEADGGGEEFKRAVSKRNGTVFPISLRAVPDHEAPDYPPELSTWFDNLHPLLTRSGRPFLRHGAVKAAKSPHVNRANAAINPVWKALLCMDNAAKLPSSSAILWMDALAWPRQRPASRFARVDCNS